MLTPKRDSGDDEDQSEDPTKRQAWATPDTPEQEHYLEACHSKWFHKKQKSRAVMILRALEAGDVLGERVHAEVLAQTQGLKAMPLHNLPPLPRTWYDWLWGRAHEGGWRQEGFGAALLNLDDLRAHCARELKLKGGARDNGKDQGFTTRSPQPETYDAAGRLVV
jgi:hypothetical protein